VRKSIGSWGNGRKHVANRASDFQLVSGSPRIRKNAENDFESRENDRETPLIE